MRNRSPRSFTVETKSGGRHQRTFIPHREVGSAAPRPTVTWPPAPLQVPAAEPRRILPSLIVPESVQVEPEPTQFHAGRMQVSEERSPRQRRGRPPKDKPIASKRVEEPVGASTLEVAAPVPVTHASVPRPARTAKTSTALPLGERWKRRLGRWSR